MTPLSAADALDLWGRGRACHPVDRALLLYAAACPQMPWAQLADTPVGRRDAVLLAWRRASFGTGLDATTQCPRCRERLAFTLDLDALEQPPGADGPIEVDGATFRLPTSRDLAQIAHEADVATATRRLFELCCVTGRDDVRLSDAVLDRAEAALAAADPQADIALDLTCDACAHAFSVDFDIAALLWQDVEAVARRALLDVDLLARAYGWSEAEILALPDARRAAYVELAG
jgi:hypothetical protein